MHVWTIAAAAGLLSAIPLAFRIPGELGGRDARAVRSVTASLACWIAIVAAHAQWPSSEPLMLVRLVAAALAASVLVVSGIRRPRTRARVVTAVTGGLVLLAGEIVVASSGGPARAVSAILVMVSIAASLGSCVTPLRRLEVDTNTMLREVLAWCAAWWIAAIVLAALGVDGAPVHVAIVVAIAAAMITLAPMQRRRRRPHLPSAARETLPALSMLTDPEAVRRSLTLVLGNMFPGSAIEVLRIDDAPALVLPSARPVSRALAEALLRRGSVLAQEHQSLGQDNAAELASFASGVLVPIVFEARLFGVLHIDHPEPTRGMIMTARRFADLLAHRLETQRLGHELDAQRRVALVGSLATAMVHDIRTPLSSARLQLQLLAVAGQPDLPAALALTELDRIAGLLADLLDLGRTPNLRDADLGDIARQAYERCRVRALGVGAVLELEPAEGPLPMRVDPDRLVRAAMNLVENAINASDADAVVSIRCGSDGERLWLEVADAGSANVNAVRDRAAFPFHSEKPTGSGLGLMIVRDSVEAFGGRLEFAQREPRGIVARLWLPRGEPEALDRTVAVGTN